MNKLVMDSIFYGIMIGFCAKSMEIIGYSKCLLDTLECIEGD